MSTNYEVIIKGDREKVHTYLAGVLTSKGIRGEHVFTDEHPFDLKAIRERFKHHGEVVHIICDADVKTVIASAIKAAPEDLGLELVETQKITRAYFEFKFYCANRQVAGQIKRIFSTLPVGVHTTDYEPEEIIDPEAKPVEGYAPVHPYEFRGEGIVEGDPIGVHKTHMKMADNEFFKVEDINIHR